MLDFEKIYLQNAFYPTLISTMIPITAAKYFEKGITKREIQTEQSQTLKKNTTI
jgi:hypothetical protein